MAFPMKVPAMKRDQESVRPSVVDWAELLGSGLAAVAEESNNSTRKELQWRSKVPVLTVFVAFNYDR